MLVSLVRHREVDCVDLDSAAARSGNKAPDRTREAFERNT